MTLLILAAVVALILLVVMKVVPIFVALVLILIVVLFAAWRLDRARGTRATPAPFLDANRPNFYGRSSQSSWEVPTPYIDHPSGAGEPPGVDRGDEPAPRR